MLEYVHHVRKVKTDYIVVYHRFAHNLINVAKRTCQRLSLYEIGNVCTFLLIALLVDSDKLQLCLEPQIIIVFV